MSGGMAGGDIVAIVFTDLVGSTALYDRLGDESAEAVRRKHFTVLRDAMERHGGSVVKSTGDGLMVVFPSAVSAVDAAVAAQRESDEGSARIGIHVGEPLEDDADFYGLAVSVTKRLCDAGGGGRIVVSALVRALVAARGRHRFEPLGPLELRGVSEPLDAFEVAWERPEAPARVDVPSQLVTAASRPIVGRHREVELVLERVTVGGLVLLKGEPGIGKTRLAAEVAQRAAGDGRIVLYGRCDEAAPSPYQPIVEALRELSRSLTPAHLRTLLGSFASDVAAVVPTIADKLAIAAPDVAVDRLRLFDGVTRLVEELGSKALLVVDDLHWAEGPTIALLDHVRHAAAGSLSVLGTYRDTDVTRSTPIAQALLHWRRDVSVIRIDVTGLDAASVAALLLPRGWDSPDARSLVQAVASETEGNPFFVHEMARHLVDLGVVDEETGAVRVTAAVSLPEGIREVVGARLSRLPDPANRVLSAASVLGSSFSLGEIAALIDETPDDVLDVVEQAIAAGVLVEDQGVRDQFSFTHALLRRALYEELATSRRLRLHTRAAAVVDDAVAAATHLLEAGAGVEAARACVIAARLTRSQAAHEASLSLAERGLDALEGDDDLAVRCDLHLAAIDACIGLSEHTRAVEHARLALDLAEALDDPARLARAAIQPARAIGPVGQFADELESFILRGLAHRRIDAVDRARLTAVRGFRTSSAADHLERSQAALAQARATGDEEALAYALMLRIDDHVTGPTPEGAHEFFAELNTLPLEGEMRGGHVVRASRWFLFQVRRGDRTGANEALALYEAKADSTPIGEWRNHSRGYRAMLDYVDGDLVASEAGALALLQATVDTQSIGWLMGGALLLTLRRAQDRLEEALAIVAGAKAMTPDVPAYALAEALYLASLGRHDEAVAAARNVENTGLGGTRGVELGLLAETAYLTSTPALAERALTGLEGWEGVLMATGAVLGAAARARGLAAAALGRYDEAVAELEAGISLERDGLRAALLVADSEIELANVLAMRGDNERAAAVRRTVAAQAAERGWTRLGRRAAEDAARWGDSP